MLEKCGCGVPNPSRNNCIMYVLPPLGRKTNKIEMEDERIKPEKVKNTKFGLFYSKIHRNSKNTPVSGSAIDILNVEDYNVLRSIFPKS